MDAHGALVDIDVAAPDAVEQLLAREHAARALHEELEQAELGGPERHFAAGAGHPPSLAVKLDVAGREHGSDTLGARAAEQGTDPGDELRQRERLDDVVVGSGGKPAHPLAFL